MSNNPILDVFHRSEISKLLKIQGELVNQLSNQYITDASRKALTADYIGYEAKITKHYADIRDLKFPQ